jgi:hypothetical protein
VASVPHSQAYFLKSTVLNFIVNVFFYIIIAGSMTYWLVVVGRDYIADFILDFFCDVLRMVCVPIYKWVSSHTE